MTYKQKQQEQNESQKVGDLTISQNDTQYERQQSIKILVCEVLGMTCTSCSSSIEQVLKQSKGIQMVSVSLLQHMAEVKFDKNQISSTEIVQLIENAGFDSNIISEKQEHTQDYRIETFTIQNFKKNESSQQLITSLEGINGVVKVNPRFLIQQIEICYRENENLEVQCMQVFATHGYVATGVGSQQSKILNISVKGMSCTQCSNSIERALKQLEGVVRANVDLMNNTAEIEYSANVTGPRDILQVVQDSGYGANIVDENQQYDLNAYQQKLRRKYWRTFLQCLVLAVPLLIVNMIMPLNGNMKKRLMAIRVGNIPIDSFIAFILATPIQFWLGRGFHIGAFKALRRRSANMDVLISLGTNIAYIYSLYQIIYVSVAPKRLGTHPNITAFFEVSATLITWIVLGKYIEVTAKGKASDALRKLVQLTPDKALLVLKNQEQSQQPQSEEVEKQGGDQISKAELYSPSAQTQAKFFRGNERVREIPAQLIQQNDILKILPGQRMPVDGFVYQGESQIDESMITGESKGVTKKKGQEVIGGTVNQTQAIYIQVSKIGSETVLSQIIRLVQKAQMEKSRIQDLADRISKYFVPTIIVIGLVVFLAWEIAGVRGSYNKNILPEYFTEFQLALQFGISVIVIACPCALGLATPTAVMVGTGMASKMGILIKGGGAALEALSKVQVLVFDKTGTLTRGQPEVKHIQKFDARLSMAELLAIIDSAETVSNHPLAYAIKLHCKQFFNIGQEGDSVEIQGTQESGDNEDNWWLLPCDNFDPITGKGIMCWSRLDFSHLQQKMKEQRVQGHEVVIDLNNENLAQDSNIASTSNLQRSKLDGQDVHLIVGSRRLLEEQEVEIPKSADNYMRQMENDGCTCVCVSVQGQLAGVVAISDPIKPEARDVIMALGRKNIEIHMVTGDNWRTARSIGEQLGIQNIEAQSMPQDKVQIVKNLKNQGKMVAMIGDGINDSPAIKQADIGIAIASGTDIAVEAADYVLMRNDLEDVLVAIDISKKVLRQIRINFMWALGYNILAIPLAAGAFFPRYKVYIPSEILGLIMAVSSVCVVSSSLLLKLYKKPKSKSTYKFVRNSLYKPMDYYKQIEDQNQVQQMMKY